MKKNLGGHPSDWVSPIGPDPWPRLVGALPFYYYRAMNGELDTCPVILRSPDPIGTTKNLRPTPLARIARLRFLTPLRCVRNDTSPVQDAHWKRLDYYVWLCKRYLLQVLPDTIANDFVNSQGQNSDQQGGQCPNCQRLEIQAEGLVQLEPLVHLD